MKTPKRLTTLVEEGLVDEVIGQLMSGKEATVYIVRCGEHIRCAKVYKDAKQRSFRKATSYQEGRKVKNSRQARAMEKGSRYGRQMQEEVWQNAEVDALYRLANVGVRVPQPYICFDGVLLMDLVVDADGGAAPRLNDVALSEAVALDYHAMLVNQVVRMLCAGIIHGDLSEYNILVDKNGPVIIDLPQAVDAAGNSAVHKFEKRFEGTYSADEKKANELLVNGKDTDGKALGVAGAFVAGSATLIDGLIQFARPYVYTTAMPSAPLWRSIDVRTRPSTNCARKSWTMPWRRPGWSRATSTTTATTTGRR